MVAEADLGGGTAMPAKFAGTMEGRSPPAMSRSHTVSGPWLTLNPEPKAAWKASAVKAPRAPPGVFGAWEPASPFRSGRLLHPSKGLAAHPTAAKVPCRKNLRLETAI